MLLTKRAIILASAALGALAALSACDSNVEQKIAVSRLAQHCLVNSDCETPLVCAFEACHAECESSRDCAAGARCVAASRPNKVCQLEEERACERGSDCAGGLVCGVDGECRDQCLTNKDCVEDQQCVSGTCADVDELDDAGQLTPAPGKVVGAEGAPCVYVSDCSGALLCRGQACLPECRADRDCPTNQVCQETRCVPDGSQPVACAYNSDCETERGQRCLGGGCRCMCAEDRDCAGGTVCDGCGCVAPPGACSYDSDCETAGEICRKGACACECKTAADCGIGALCDGCGCVPEGTPIAGIVVGDVIVDSSLQLPQYRGVTEIYGQLMIAGPNIADLGDTFDQLTLVQGTVLVGTNQALEVVRFPKLKSTPAFTVNGATKVKRVEAPQLATTDIALFSLDSLESVDFEGWRSGSFSGNGLGHLKSLSLPVEELLWFQIFGNNELEALSLPDLTYVRSNFYLSANGPAPLASLSLPKLSQFGDGESNAQFTLEYSSLTSLTGVGTTDWTVKATGLRMLYNSKLGTCAAKAFVDRFGVPASAQVVTSNLDDCAGTCDPETATCTGN